MFVWVEVMLEGNSYKIQKFPLYHDKAIYDHKWGFWKPSMDKEHDWISPFVDVPGAARIIKESTFEQKPWKQW